MKYSKDLVCDLIDYIENNLYSKITINDLSHKFSYDRYYLMKLFKKEIGVSVIEFINRFRIYYSIVSIHDTNYSLTRIAIMYGFSSLEYFSEVFHQVMGVSARDYQSYIKKRYLKDMNKVYIILEYWADLQAFYEKVRKYKKNRKPNVVPILKRSIFD